MPYRGRKDPMLTPFPLLLPYCLRGFIVTACLLLITDPVRAEGTPPAPPSTIVGELSTAAQTLGVVSVVAIIAVLIMLVAVAALFVGIYRLGKPLVDNIAIANRRADEAADAERKAREEQQEASSTHLKITDQRERETLAVSTRQAEAMKALGGSMVTLGGTMERITKTMNENDKLSEEGRTEAVKAINKHTDEQIDALRKDIKPMDAKLDVILKHVVPGEKPDDVAPPDEDPAAPPAPVEPEA